MPAKRHLAAIMFTDIVGYTAMMNENEAAAIKIRQRHRNIFEKEHRRYHGEIIQYYGDGTLSTFKSAVEAVECAISMQQAFQDQPVVPLRIGIHLGDIVFDESEVYGDGVNVASRIETLGIPGCILVSGITQRAIQSHAVFKTKSLGFFEFKNVKEPLEVFALHNQGIRVPGRSELKGKLKQIGKSIAVLPFVNMSADPDNEYFSDGITEEILNALAKVAGLQVTARTSAFSFKGKNLDVREIGRQLGVKHILEGSVRKAGNRVRITAQLVSSVDGYHFFSETYDRTLEDIFEVQDEIAQKITNRLREHLGESEHQQQLVKPPTLNMEAYEIYLKGLFYFNQWGETMSKAIPYFEKAIELQEDFALPHAKLGACYYFYAFGGGIAWDKAYEKIRYHVARTKELKTESPEVYFSFFVHDVFVQWDWKAAVESTTKGLKHFPNFASLYHLLASLYWIKGDLKNVMRIHKKGLALDPLSIEMNLYMGVIYLWDKDYENAILYFDKVLELVPHHRAAREYKGWVAAFQQKYEAAVAIFKALEPIGYHHHQATCLGWVYHKQGKYDQALACLETIKQLEGGSARGNSFTVDLAILFTTMGNFDQAFDYLEKAIINRIGSIMMVGADQWLSPLKADPRFAKIETLIGEVPPIDY